MKQMMKKQLGIGFWGWSSILAILGLIVLFGLRLFPLYNEKFLVDQSMQSVANRPDAAKLSVDEIRKYFLKNAQINGSNRFNDRNIKTHLKMNKPEKGKPKSFTVTFEARNKLFDVIELLLVYNNTVELAKNAEGG